MLRTECRGSVCEVGPDSALFNLTCVSSSADCACKGSRCGCTACILALQRVATAPGLRVVEPRGGGYFFLKSMETPLMQYLSPVLLPLWPASCKCAQH